MSEVEKDKALERVVGLKYEPGKSLPRVILKGSGVQAREIIDYGKRIGGPPLIEDKKLLDQLYQLPMDAEIGPELFELVAAILVHVYTIGERVNRTEK